MALQKKNSKKEIEMEMINKEDQIEQAEQIDNSKKPRKPREHKDKPIFMILDCGEGEHADKENFKVVGATENKKKLASAIAEAQLSLAGHWLAVGMVFSNCKNPLDAKLDIAKAVRQQAD